jgi:hypothetical protein
MRYFQLIVILSISIFLAYGQRTTTTSLFESVIRTVTTRSSSTTSRRTPTTKPSLDEWPDDEESDEPKDDEEDKKTKRNIIVTAAVVPSVALIAGIGGFIIYRRRVVGARNVQTGVRGRAVNVQVANPMFDTETTFKENPMFESAHSIHGSVSGLNEQTA